LWGGMFLALSFPGRIALGDTEAWLAFARWLVRWAERKAVSSGVRRTVGKLGSLERTVLARAELFKCWPNRR